MDDTVCINITGPALAMLLYENVKTTGSQEGFLLGDVSEIVVQTVTDADSQNVALRKLVNVTAVIPCVQSCLFYNVIGQINRNTLKDILGDQEKNVVAWYKYSYNSRFKLTMRDKLIHKELSAHFPIANELFASCVLSAMNSVSQTTWTYSHGFIRYHKNKFQLIPIHIDNLGENCNLYKPNVTASPMFLKMCSAIGKNRSRMLDWDFIHDIQDALQKEIGKSVVQLSKFEQKSYELELEVQELRKTVLNKREEKYQRIKERNQRMPENVIRTVEYKENDGKVSLNIMYDRCNTNETISNSPKVDILIDLTSDN